MNSLFSWVLVCIVHDFLCLFETPLKVRTAKTLCRETAQLSKFYNSVMTQKKNPSGINRNVVYLLVWSERAPGRCPAQERQREASLKQRIKPHQDKQWNIYSTREMHKNYFSIDIEMSKHQQQELLPLFVKTSDFQMFFRIWSLQCCVTFFIFSVMPLGLAPWGVVQVKLLSVKSSSFFLLSVLKEILYSYNFHLIRWMNWPRTIK